MKILVTSVGGNSVGAQIVKALRNSNLNCEVIGADADKTANLNVELDKFELIPLATDATYVDKLIALHDKHKFEILLCGNERELNVLSSAKSKFLAKGVYLPIANQNVLDICLDKMNTNKFLIEKKFNIPKSIIIKDDTDLRAVDWFPAIIKPYKGGSGSKGVNIVRNMAECQAYLDYIKLLNPSQNIMLQEYIGHSSEEYTVGVLNSNSGFHLGSIVMQRDLTNPINVKLSIENNTNKSFLGEKLVVSTGISTGRFCIHNKISDECVRLCGALGATGPMNIQCRVQDNKVFIFEINPRFSGTTSSRSMVGFNEVEILINNDFLGSKNHSIDYELSYVNRIITEARG